MGRYLPIIIVALLMIYCVVEVAQAPRYAVRRMPRWAWATVVICLPLAGAVGWLFLGRPNAESLGKKTRPERRPAAPDDDPDFLRGLG
jgi:sorbitol-specific phosphotransferase system component IIC